MIRRLPVIPTLIVLAAVAVMIRLGFWQIDRMHQKEALLARYAAAGEMSADVPFPQSEAASEPVLYRHATIDCFKVTSTTTIAGQNARGEAGLAHIADCELAGGGKARVALGWSRSPAEAVWSGGKVRGTIAPGPRLIADPPLAGLEANARPDPSAIPNNHWSYAVQWFLFAAVALVIYGLAVRKRLKP
ncbi:MAG: SURF1 family cytochrome oxidase biogenesis protein [Novosphingobium sp.]